MQELPVDGPIVVNAPEGVRVRAHGSTVEHRTTPKPVAAAAFPYSPEVMREIDKPYDPDTMQDVMPRMISESEAAARLVARKKITELDAVAGTEGSGETTINGHLVVASGLRTSRLVRFDGWDQLNELQASPEFIAQRLREHRGQYTHPKRLREALSRLQEGEDAFAFGAPFGGAGGRAPNDEYHPITLGPYSRNQYLFDFLDQGSKAFQAYHHSPIMRNGIDTGVSFVMGDGVRVVFASPLCQEIWDAWMRGLEVSGITFQDKLRQMYRDACVIGEVFAYMPKNPLTGWPMFKLWDASTVWEIVTDPRDIERVFYAYRQFYTQYQYPFAVQGELPAPVAEYVIEQVTPDQWLHLKLNATVGEKRGRSDLFPVLGWNKRFKDWFTAATVSAQISNSFVIWWKVNGGQEDVDALRNNPNFTKVPPPGSAFFTNEQVTPTLLRPEKGGEIGNVGEALLSVIATGMHLPPEYLGVGGKAPRATALTRAEPSIKFFEQRQQLVREAVSYMARRVLDAAERMDKLPKLEPKKATVSLLLQAYRSGRYDKAQMIIEAAANSQASYMEPLNRDFEVVMPALQPEDEGTTLKNYATLRATKVWSQKTFATRAAELLGDDKYDFETEQDQMRLEQETGVISMDSMPPGMAGPEGGQDKPEGGSEDNQDYRRDTKEKPRE